MQRDLSTLCLVIELLLSYTFDEFRTLTMSMFITDLRRRHT
jgi:hypothetical protein